MVPLFSLTLPLAPSSSSGSASETTVNPNRSSLVSVGRAEGAADVGVAVVGAAVVGETVGVPGVPVGAIVVGDKVVGAAVGAPETGAALSSSTLAAVAS